MNLFSAAERLAAIDRSAVVLNPARCLHDLDKHVACNSCQHVCPASAIAAGPEGSAPTLVSSNCQGCLACLPACPTGAFSADDEVSALLTCAARLESKQVVLACGSHPAPSQSCSEDQPAIHLHGCLAGIGSGGLLALAALGFERIILRLDACTRCRWEVLQPVIAEQASAACSLLASWGRGEEAIVTLVTPFESNSAETPAVDIHNPPLSRRDLFRMASIKGQVAFARALAAERPSGARRPSHDRIRLTEAARRLQSTAAALSAESLPVETATAPGFATLTVSEACTACGVCARACPTAALTFTKDIESLTYSLAFSPADCIACSLCARDCLPATIEISFNPPVPHVFGAEHQVMLQEGSLTRCKRCNILIAAHPDQLYCPLCEFRRQNPLGVAVPPGLRDRKSIRGAGS